jgi:argininosuccinate lyase
MKAWDGRFDKGTEPLMEQFSSSIGVDWRLFPYDIKGSIAYAEMLFKIGILNQREMSWKWGDFLSKKLSKISTCI